MDCAIPTASTMDQSTQTGMNQAWLIDFVLYTIIIIFLLLLE
jgi:heme/copper-type cytochrome/quinol oxidase subunit 2